jgi:hypothetical protein
VGCAAFAPAALVAVAFTGALRAVGATAALDSVDFDGSTVTDGSTVVDGIVSELIGAFEVAARCARVRVGLD